jgi:NAD(P)H-dependent FMN reductase
MLLGAATEMAPPGTTIEIASIREIPLYDGDLEAESGIPAPVAALKERIAAADGLLLVTPEYNNSLPGVFKNAIDWLTRPPADIRRVFGSRPVGVIGATPGPGATILAQTAWLPVLRTLGTLPWFGPRVAVSNAAKVFDEQGKLQDPAVRTQLEKFVAGFAEFVSRASARR